MRDNDSMYYDLYQEGELPKERSKAGKIVSAVFKTAGITLILAVYGILFYRIWGQSEPKMATEYLWTDTAIAAQAEGSVDAGDAGESFRIFTQTPKNYTLHNDETGESTVVRRDEYYTTEEGSEIDGNYKFSNFCYTPMAGQVQVSFRYNRAVLPYVRKDYGVETLPDYPFVFALMSADGTLYTDYRFTAGKRGLHTYRHLVFEGLPEDGLGSLLYLNVYYIGKVDLQHSYLSMVIYDEKLPLEEREEKPTGVSSTEPAPAYKVYGKTQEDSDGSSSGDSSETP